MLYDNLIRGNPTVSTLGIDNNEVIGQAVDALYGMGHRKIGYLSGALGSHIYQVRYKSFFTEVRRRRLPASSSLAGYSYYFSETLETHLPRLLAQGVTAILCSSDLLAHTVLIRCQELGIRVPEQLSIVGFDDLPFCAHTAPPLTHHPAGPAAAGQERLLRPGQPAERGAHQQPAAARPADPAGVHRPRPRTPLRRKKNMTKNTRWS